MNTPPPTNPHKRHRFPAEIISHGVWLYCRFCLSYQEVEELMAARGVILTYEAALVVPKVRASLCESVAPSESQTRGQVAPG
jgi:transposase-like protein